MILVTGGTGTVGRDLVAALVGQGQRVRVLARDPQRAAALLPAGIEVVPGDLEDRASLRAALAGIGRAYLLSGGPQQAHVELGFVKVAREMGLDHLLKHSAQATGTDPPPEHGRVEAAIVRSGLTYTILRPVTFMQNLFRFAAPTIAAEGRFFAVGVEVPLGMVDTRDIARCGAAILADAGPHREQTYVLTGPETLTWAGIAGTLSVVTGRTVTAADVSVEELRRRLVADGQPEPAAATMAAIFANLATGASAVVTDDVARLTGRPPTPFEQFARDHAAAFMPAGRAA